MMKKRFVALVTVWCILMGQSFGAVQAAERETNAYGHPITYAPVTTLYTGGKPVRFFDAGVTEWGKLSDKITANEAESMKWLQNNGYLLNRFGRNFSGSALSDCFNAKGEWLSQLKGPRNVRKWYANVRFPALADQEQRENGNIANMFDKGDIQYFFSWKVKTVQTRWGLTGKSNDTGFTTALGEWVESSGGGWKKYHTLSDGPNFGDFSAWKNGDDLGVIGFMAMSDKDAQVDSYLSGAILAGRDVKGPRIDSVRVTADPEGEQEIENGTVTLDNIDRLSDRTVYFRVQWDEPVVFKNMTQSEIAKLNLHVETVGIDGTGGMIAEAPFYKFAPSKTDGKPVMIFEYKIADPYTDVSQVAQERGFFYRFSKVNVSENDNAAFWNHICDLSDNRFAADENGQQPAGKVAAIVSGSPKVDLIPFGIKNMKMTKKSGDSDAFIKNGDVLAVTLALNKPMVRGTKIAALPKIKLNIEDVDGNDVVIAPSEEELKQKYYVPGSGTWQESGWLWIDGDRVRPAEPSDDRTAITYYVQLHEGYRIKDGTSVKVTAVLPDSEMPADESGYTLMCYDRDGDGMLAPKDLPKGAAGKREAYKVSPDKQYKMDFDPPQIHVLANDEGGGVLQITAEIDDGLLEGCDASFTVQVSGRTDGDGVAYQASASGNYSDSLWQQSENGAQNVSFGSPIQNKRAYGFIKLPDKCEADKIDISITVSDEAGNTASAAHSMSAPDWEGYDTLAPSVTATVTGDDVAVYLTDRDDAVTYAYGFSENETEEPDYTEASGKEGIISAPDLPSENAVFERVLWIKARDAHGNESEAIRFPVKYDRRYADIRYTTDTEKQYLVGEYPSIEFSVDHVTAYWYMWAEKPANVFDTAAYISDHCLDDMRNRARDVYCYYSLSEDGSVVADAKGRIAEFDPDTAWIAAIGSEGETYGENVRFDQTSRPIMLVLAAEKEDGGTLVKTVEYNTFYGAPNAKVRLKRFSTNDSTGKRADFIRDSEGGGLIWADDAYENPVNTPDLYGFAQAEIQLVGDPVTKLDRVDMENSFVRLKRVLYNGACTPENLDTDTVVGSWKLSDLDFGTSDGGDMRAILDLDPRSLDTDYLETDEPYVDEDGIAYPRCRTVRYEWEADMAYLGGIAPRSAPMAYFAFDNTPDGFIDGTYYNFHDWIMSYHDFGDIEKRNREVLFDQNGNDVTADVPVYTVSTSHPETNGYEMYLRFSAPGGRYYGGDAAYYGTPVQNKVDPNNTEKLTVRIGTDPNHLSEELKFSKSGEIASEYYDIGRYLYGPEKEIREVKLYYQFCHPERGTASPLYVMILRRDNAEPVIDITLSETKRKTNEVLLKVNGVYDIQTAADGSVVTDTPESALIDYMRGHNGDAWLGAWRYATDQDDLSKIPEEDISYHGVYDEETGDYITKETVRVWPDENGIYHFTSNGYFTPDTRDYAGNRSYFMLINGERFELENADYLTYEITNVDRVPPRFVTAPTFTEGDGKFTLSAKADGTVKNVFLKFDESYTDMLLENTVGSAESSAMFNIKDVPGMLFGTFDEETGEIRAEIYGKDSESVPLTAVTLVIVDSAGNKTEYPYSFTAPIYGKKAEVTNAKNANGYPVYRYGETLDFTVPVKVDGAADSYAASHRDLPIYRDGITSVVYTDLFGEEQTQDIEANVFGAAFSHTLIFTADGKEITPQTPVSGDVRVKIDTSKTEGLSVDGGETEATFRENGTLRYTLINESLAQDNRRTFAFPVTNIDKTPPEAIVSLHLESETDIETNERRVYAATYTVEGFNEDGVTLLPPNGGAAPQTVTFDAASDEKTYTFRFRDAAGNEGAYLADASDIVFSERTDTKIANYRLTYAAADDNGFQTIGRFEAGDAVQNLGLVNRAVSVSVQALNQNGDAVSSVMQADGDLPNGVSVYEKEKTVVFAAESGEDRTVTVTLIGSGDNNTVRVPVTLPANTVDLTAPTGTVVYQPSENSVRAYLVTDAADLADGGVYVTGSKNDGTPFLLAHDENGYYTELDKNGTGSFILLDKAGNIGRVAIAVLTIDTEPPVIAQEVWQSVIDAKTQEEIRELLSLPTNNSIKLYITFNEQLKNAEVKAFRDGEGQEELKPTDDYVTAVISGTSLTVEFKQNCLAKLTVYDLRGNAFSLWRPEDGPISVIDRDIPKPAEGYPLITYDKDRNETKAEYVFADGEEVMLLQNPNDGYQNRHVISILENGEKIFNFADRAGNVYTDYRVITAMDELAPRILMNLDYVGEGSVLSGNDSYKAGNMYTSKDARILLKVDDETKEGMTVTAKTARGAFVAVKKEAVTLGDTTYDYNLTVSENGVYQIAAADCWGHENTVTANISVIDKTAPSIRFQSNAVTLQTGTEEKEAERQILADITVQDLQSGANAPLGDAFGSVDDGVTVSLDLSGVNLKKEGIYPVKVTAADRLGNTAEKSHIVTVMKDVYRFTVNGTPVYANDVVTAAKGRIRLQGAEGATYYYAKGHKTAAQMKYAKGFAPDAGFDALQNGYYTVLAKESGRRMYLVYVYVN